MVRTGENARKFRFSKLSCPVCGDATRAVVRAGTVRVRCERCDANIHMTIRLVGAEHDLGTGQHVPREQVVCSPEPVFKGYTELMCPACGRRTGVSIHTGAAIVYCRRCKTLIEITVDVVRKLEKTHARGGN